MKYHITTYGCQMNHSDSERIATVLENMKYKPASNINGADLIVVNMCSVRQSAVDRVYGLIPKFKKLSTDNHQLTTILTGCILKSDLKKFKSNFDYILSIKALNYWKDFLKKEKYIYYPDPRDEKFNQKFNLDYLEIKPGRQTNFRALIPISTGCNNFCTFCVVPYTRGPEFSRDHQEILEEAEQAIKKEAKEIWLLGQNVNSYQSPANSSINFAKLLKMVNNLPGNFWIRFTSSHPKDLSEELINTIAQSKKVTEYLNLPVQSGNNQILKKMGRPYTIKHYKNLISKIRKKIPNISLSTDIIVGFPGETKKQFQDTIKLFQEIKFDMAYISRYSKRSGTTAAKMKNSISPQEEKRREKALTEVLEKTALEKNKNYLGKEVEILVDKEKNGFSLGKTRTYKTVKVKAEKNENLTGKFAKAKIIKVLSWGLKGKKN